MLKAYSSAVIGAIGLLLLAVGLAAYCYPAYTQWQHNLLSQGPMQEMLPASFTSANSNGTPISEQESTTPTPLPVFTPTPLSADYGEGIYLSIPGIKLDAPIIEAPFRDGTFVVPLYDVGHHQGTPNPGETGNSILVGHVETISAGQVFAHLSEVKVGDAVYIFTPTHRTDWVVTEVKPYPVGDNTFLLQGQDVRLTLYTCYGTWDWDRHDYNQRLAVVAKFVAASRTDNPD